MLETNRAKGRAVIVTISHTAFVGTVGVHLDRLSGQYVLGPHRLGYGRMLVFHLETKVTYLLSIEFVFPLDNFLYQLPFGIV